MNERQLGPVTIEDNGLTSFVPPCFHWELRSSAGEIIETVSDIDSSFSVSVDIEEIVTRRMRVSGRLVNCPCANGQVGVRFVIEALNSPDL